MQGRNIKVHIRKKVDDWIESIEDESLRGIAKDNVIVTGGAIVSLLQDEEPNDYDVYFRTADSLKKIVEYYLNKFIEKAGDKEQYNPQLQRCCWNEGRQAWSVLKEGESKNDERLRIFIKSEGAAGLGYDTHSETDLDYKRALAKLNNEVKEKRKEDGEAYLHIFQCS